VLKRVPFADIWLHFTRKHAPVFCGAIRDTSKARGLAAKMRRDAADKLPRKMSHKTNAAYSAVIKGSRWMSDGGEGSSSDARTSYTSRPRLPLASTDFGSDDYLPGFLRVLLGSDRDADARLIKRGAKPADALIINTLCARAVTEQGWKDYPEFRRSNIAQPIVITPACRALAQIAFRQVARDRPPSSRLRALVFFTTCPQYFLGSPVRGGMLGVLIRTCHGRSSLTAFSKARQTFAVRTTSS